MSHGKRDGMNNEDANLRLYSEIWLREVKAVRTMWECERGSRSSKEGAALGGRDA